MTRYIKLLITLLLAIPCAAIGQQAVELNNAGIEAYNAGQYPAAIAYFEKAYTIAGGNSTVSHNLANAHQAVANWLAKDNNFQAACKELELAISIDPQNVSPVTQLGSYYLRLRRVPEAIFRLEQAIQMKPTDLDAHELLGEAYYEDNDLPSTRAQWDYVLAMDPTRPGLKERYDKAFREESIEDGFSKAGSHHFKISAPKSVPYNERSRILTILEHAYTDIGHKLGGIYPPPPVQVIVYDGKQFTEATRLDPHVGAVYDGKIRIPYADEQGQPIAEDELKRRLTHEYVHVVVRQIADDKVPFWLNEGMAEAFSTPLQPAEVDSLTRAIAHGRLFSLASLEGQQLEKLNPEILRLAYDQSHATVNLLWTRFGPQRLTQLLRDLSSGMKPEAALQKIYRKSYAALEKEVAATIQ